MAKARNNRADAGLVEHVGFDVFCAALTQIAGDQITERDDKEAADYIYAAEVRLRADLTEIDTLKATIARLREGAWVGNPPK
ncbi:MAG TPA: hypothetical protein VIJ93_00605 [bacterium]